MDFLFHWTNNSVSQKKMKRIYSKFQLIIEKDPNEKQISEKDISSC